MLEQFGRRGARAAYQRFVAEGIGRASPWDKLKRQIWLGGEAFLKRMERLAQAKSGANVPRMQRRVGRQTARSVTERVLARYRIKDERALCSRANQEAFQAWVYLLRRLVNLPLQAVAERGKVSPSRISKIQRAIEMKRPSEALRKLLDECQVKN